MGVQIRRVHASQHRAFSHRITTIGAQQPGWLRRNREFDCGAVEFVTDHPSPGGEYR